VAEDVILRRDFPLFTWQQFILIVDMLLLKVIQKQLILPENPGCLNVHQLLFPWVVLFRRHVFMSMAVAGVDLDLKMAFFCDCIHTLSTPQIFPQF